MEMEMSESLQFLDYTRRTSLIPGEQTSLGGEQNATISYVYIFTRVNMPTVRHPACHTQTLNRVKL